MTDSTFLTPAAAAKRAGCGRTKIMKAIENKALKAVRSNRNRWQIKSEDLEDWMTANIEETQSDSDADSQNDTETTVKITRLEAENEALKSRITELREDRDAWRAQAQKSLWKRLFG